MTELFLISDDQLHTLSATRQGRVSIAGYNYQAAYAVLRLVSMSMRQPLLDLDDWPLRMRYDWGEDLDELCADNSVRFTQCKRVDTIGQPASVADVLSGFAPKWLWVPETARTRLRFRLVCSDPRFALGSTLPASLRVDVRRHFLARLQKPASPQSDISVWIDQAHAVGPEALFDALWARLDFVYLPAQVIDSEFAGPRLAAEKEALRVLLERGRIGSTVQMDVLARLRRLIHDNLIAFDPSNESPPLPFDQSPRRLDRADVDAAIDPWRPTTQRQPPFQLVDRTFLSEQRELERRQFVARQPDWCDVAHGRDEIIKFIEREQTEALEMAVLENVVAGIGRSSKLPALFVVGAPGDGKTTIVRRVATRLVDAGLLLIADTGVGLREPPGDPDEYIQAIERLQNYGRPVVLLLDDPLYSDSQWFNVLRSLARPGLKVGVLAASPQFLLDEHKSKLKACDVSTFEIARTSPSERETLATLYGRPVPSSTEEDFLIVAMETAADASFRDIIDRLWLTLADGHDLSSARSVPDLSWQTRAYLFVCFFSRANEACFEPMLLKLLEITGGVPGTSDVHTELQRMKHFAGWRIFRIGKSEQAFRNPKQLRPSPSAQRARTNFASLGAPISAAHTVIAQQAWEQRPLNWCDFDSLVIEASVCVPELISELTLLAIKLASPPFADPIPSKDGSDFVSSLLERWRHASDVETRYICKLATTISLYGTIPWVLSLEETLTHRAIPDAQGWMAALRLCYLRSDLEKQQGLPDEVELLPLIEAADFSIASGSALRFGKFLESDEMLWNAFVARLLDAVDGKLAWSLDDLLVTHLLAKLSARQLSAHIPQIVMWLNNHPSATTARAKYLSFVNQLSNEYAGVRLDAVRQTAEWLDTRDEGSQVRTLYLSLILQLPAEFSDLRREAAHQTAAWLGAHDEDSQVRMRYLSYLLQLPAEFSDLRREAARQTVAWLEAHDEETDVRATLMHFLSETPYIQRATPGLMQVGEWQQLASAALNGAANLVVKSGYQSKHVDLFQSLFNLHHEAFRSLYLRESDLIRRALKLSHDVADAWFVKYPTSSVQYDLPLPEEFGM